MHEHHRKTIDKLIERFKEDYKFLALIIGGSIAKGREKEDSDVDIMLVATDEEYQRRKENKDFHYYTTDVCDYAGGYVDGKVINLQFLIDAADHGSEPARAAFRGAFAAYSNIPDIEKILTKIPIYPEQEQKKKIQSYYSQFIGSRWCIDEAEKRGSIYLLSHAAKEMVFFGGRLILAHNKILYPYHKWFMTEIMNAEEKPEDFIDLSEKLLAKPCSQNAQLLYDSVDKFKDWETPPEGWVNRFYEDIEWTWLEGRTTIYDK